MTWTIFYVNQPMKIIPFSIVDFMLERITFLASLWCFAHGLLSGVPLADIQRDWHIFLHGLSL